MFIKVRLSSVLLIVAAFVLVFVSFNSLASAKSETEGVGNRQLLTNPDGAINYVVSGGPGFVSVAGAAFSPMDDEYEWRSIYGYITNRSSSLGGSFEAPIILPHGATVTKFVAYYFDSSSEKDLTVRLLRMPFEGFESEIMAQVVTVGAYYEYSYLYDDSIQYAAVDNQSNSYLAVVDLPSGTFNTIGLIGLRVDYTFPNYLPCVTK